MCHRIAESALEGLWAERVRPTLRLAAATGAPIQVADQVMDQLAVPAQDDLLGQFTRDVPLPRPKRHGFARLFRGHPRAA